MNSVSNPNTAACHGSSKPFTQNAQSKINIVVAEATHQRPHFLDGLNCGAARKNATSVSMRPCARSSASVGLDTREKGGTGMGAVYVMEVTMDEGKRERETRRQ